MANEHGNVNVSYRNGFSFTYYRYSITYNLYRLSETFHETRIVNMAETRWVFGE